MKYGGKTYEVSWGVAFNKPACLFFTPGDKDPTFAIRKNPDTGKLVRIGGKIQSNYEEHEDSDACKKLVKK